jgi:hypothetical protein
MSSTIEMDGLEQKCQRRRNKRLSRAWGRNDDEFAGNRAITPIAAARELVVASVSAGA